MFNKEGIYFLALGGAEEVGFNCYAYAIDGKIIIVDTGYGFLNDDFPGIELGLADISVLENYKEDIEAIFITHSHEDHFGAIAHIWPKFQCPVYATDFALGHIRDRLREYNLSEIVDLRSATQSPNIKLGNINVEYIPLAHSTPENSALYIRTPYGNIFHATDWRFDDGCLDMLPTGHNALNKAASDGVMLYVGDSTNMANVEQEPSEMQIRESLIKLVPTFSNTLVATCFASNIMRLESLILAAHEAGRTPVIAGRSLMQNLTIAKECGYLKDLPTYLDAKQASDIPLDKILYICAGSQGNYRSGLSRIVNGENKSIQLGQGDAIIFSSKIIPGNEQKIERMQEKLRDLGVDVITNEEYLVHASGHAGKDEIKKMYELLKPQIVLPVHGDKHNIREQKRFAQSCGINTIAWVKNGDVILLKDGKHEIVGNVPTDIIGVDRNQLTSLSSQLIKNRKRIAFNCSLFISVFFNADWSLENLQVSSIDIIDEISFNQWREEIIPEMIKSIPDEVKRLNYKESAIKEYIAAKIRKSIYKQTDIKPVVFFHFYKKEISDASFQFAEEANKQ